MKQPEALRLADELQDEFRAIAYRLPAAAELRRLHEVNQELVSALTNLDDVFCSNDYATREGRHIARLALIAARAAIAKAGAA